MALPRPTVKNGLIVIVAVYGLSRYFTKPTELEIELAARPAITREQSRARFDAYMKKYKYDTHGKLPRSSGFETSAAATGSPTDLAPTTSGEVASTWAPPTEAAPEPAPAAAATPVENAAVTPPADPSAIPAPAAAAMRAEPAVGGPPPNAAAVPTAPPTDPPAAAAEPTPAASDVVAEPAGAAAPVPSATPSSPPATGRTPVSEVPPTPASPAGPTVHTEVVRDPRPSLKDRLMKKSFTKTN